MKSILFALRFNELLGCAIENSIQPHHEPPPIVQSSGAPHKIYAKFAIAITIDSSALKE
jgi:hypothetical protein